MNKKIFTILISFLIIFSFKIHAQTLDSEFNPNFIISDFELENYNDFDLSDIQYFLNKHLGILKYYVTNNTENGKLMTASEIIYQASQKYKINPKYLLTLLQKEQSLITNPHPTVKALNWATGYAVCDSCNMNDPYLQKYKGFYNQIIYAAQRNRFYIDHQNKEWLFQKGINYNIDGQIIMPYNQATACLYNYTPHIDGNYNFWKIWNKWFTRKYPNGSILKEHNSAGIWLIKENKRWPFITWTAFTSRYKAQDIIEVNHNDLIKYPIGPAIKFANYSYLRTPNKQIYLLNNNKLKPFANSEVVKYFGVNPEEIIDIQWEDYRYYEKGAEITMNSIYPNGAILENEKTKEIYYVQDGNKALIMDQKILEINYPQQIVIKVSEEELKNLKEIEKIKFKDGTLIKSKNNSAVYIISDGRRRPILNEQIFENLKYNWNDIVEVNQKIVEIHDLGSPIQEQEEKINKEELLPNNRISKPL